jgi:Concanavalin A-like lectin/glucanases superfamily
VSVPAPTPTTKSKEDRTATITTYAFGSDGIPGSGGDKSISVVGADSYVEIAHRQSYNLNAFTIELWVHFDSFGSKDCYRELIKKGQDTRERNFALFLRPDRADTAGDESRTVGYYFGKQDATGEPQAYNYTVTPLDPERWYHLAFVHAKDGPVLLYVNGELEPHSPTVPVGASRGTPVNSKQPITVGTSRQCPEYPIGRIDELAIYNADLSSPAIADHYVAGSRNR